MHAERLVQQCLARERFHASRAVRFNLRQCEAHDRKYTTNYLCTKTDFVCLCKLNGWFSSVLLRVEVSRLTVYATLDETVSRLPQETHSNYFSRRPRTTGYGRNCKSRPDHSWEHLAAYRRTDHRNSCASNLKEIVEMTEAIVKIIQFAPQERVSEHILTDCRFVSASDLEEIIDLISGECSCGPSR